MRRPMPLPEDECPDIETLLACKITEKPSVVLNDVELDAAEAPENGKGEASAMRARGRGRCGGCGDGEDHEDKTGDEAEDDDDE